MKTLLRLSLSFVSAVAALYFVYWVGGAVLLSLRLPLWVPFLIAIPTAVSVGGYVWLHTASMHLGLVSSVAVGAFATGGIGFSAGFFGPILFMPHSNQGPLLGIFITGPLGFLLGGIGGAINWFVRNRRAGRALNTAL